jgi:succinate dehydrogenase (ubiquinone) cytochrome b560 subunit
LTAFLFPVFICVGLYASSMLYALAPFQSSAVVAAVSATPAVIGFAAKFLLSAPYTYHTFNGIRHLVFDSMCIYLRF